MAKVEFTRDTTRFEWPERIPKGDVRELPPDQVQRWLKRNAVRVLSDEEPADDDSSSNSLDEESTTVSDAETPPANTASKESANEETQPNPKPARKRSRKKAS